MQRSAMRSYYAHLETTAAKTITQKPVLRTSAIFPVMQRTGMTSRLLFLGYWILKRHIKEIAMVVTLRNLQGQVLFRDLSTITEAKTFRIELTDCLKQTELAPNADFDGSLEVEFFSTQNLVFPYPAVTVNYYGPSFSSVVHTAQRTYNDFEDMQRNSESNVPECGFNIYADANREPVIGLVNGPEEAAAQIFEIMLYNLHGETLSLNIPMERLAPYQTTWIYPARLCKLEDFLKGESGTAKLKFHVNWIFPRLLVGNIQSSPPGFVITHSYYDTSHSTSDRDYWLTPEPGWFTASLMLPLDLTQGLNTSVYFYPIYSPGAFAIHVEVYDRHGRLLKKDKEGIRLGNGGFHRLDLGAFCENLSREDFLGVRLLAVPLEENRLPARVKVAIDIGHPEQALPCNICTNLQPYVPGWQQKPSTFRWGPVLADQPLAKVWIMNSSPQDPYNKETKVTITFFHEQDSQTLVRELSIPPQGFIVINPKEDPELDTFFNNTVGWFTAIADNPYTTTYYFAESAAGIVGGDHGY